MKLAAYQAHNLQSGPQGQNLVPDQAEQLSDHWAHPQLPSASHIHQVLRLPFPFQSGLQFLTSEESLRSHQSLDAGLEVGASGNHMTPILQLDLVL